MLAMKNYSKYVSWFICVPLEQGAVVKGEKLKPLYTLNRFL